MFIRRGLTLVRQGLGMALSLPDKIKVAKRLDEMGFDYIEGGYPLSNPKDQGHAAADPGGGGG